MNENAASAGHLNRGRVLSAQQIATEFFSDTRKEKWVRKTVAPTRRMRLGHSTLRWYERDVMEWLDGRRGSS
jgi:hypothetical protein